VEGGYAIVTVQHNDYTVGEATRGPESLISSRKVSLYYLCPRFPPTATV